ncbi:hypothetical protein BU15DRAFT_66911 [Melanogaster broomeanus]|nr:hypothetical protein BU15DRAFT_66911 [Melanogaster broomeanus]
MSDVNVASTDERSARIREELIDSGLYLGDRKILQHVEWKANGRKESLFVKEAPPTPSSDSEEQKPLSEDIVADLATLSAVVRVNDNGFWLTSDAGWRVPTNIAPHLHDAKGSCVGVSPVTGVFRDDFFIWVENARMLQQRIATPDSEERLGFACKGEREPMEDEKRRGIGQKSLASGQQEMAPIDSDRRWRRRKGQPSTLTTREKDESSVRGAHKSWHPSTVTDDWDEVMTTVQCEGPTRSKRTNYDPGETLQARFFGNLSLPRIFEYVEVSGFGHVGSLAIRNGSASRGKTLCQHIAAKQPLALALARCVKVCYITQRPLDLECSPQLQTLSQIQFTGLSHMTNICKLRISHLTVDITFWDVAATLESLQELCFKHCDFSESPVDLDPDKKLKVPCLEVFWCEGACPLSATVDAPHLRTLTMDMIFVNCNHRQIDWLSETAVTELRIYTFFEPVMRDILSLRNTLRHTPHCLQVLELPIYPFSDLSQILFEDPAWRNMPYLHSLTLEVWRHGILPMAVLRSICDGVRVQRGLQSFSLQDSPRNPSPPVISRAGIRQIVDEELSCMPGLNFVQIYWASVRLVDGKWMDA